MTKINFIFEVKRISHPFPSYYDTINKDIIISLPKYWNPSDDIKNEEKHNFKDKEHDDIRIRALISSISHEVIHAVLHQEINLEATINFDNICYMLDDHWIVDYVNNNLNETEIETFLEILEAEHPNAYMFFKK